MAPRYPKVRFIALVLGLGSIRVLVLLLKSQQSRLDTGNLLFWFTDTKSDKASKAKEINVNYEAQPAAKSTGKKPVKNRREKKKTPKDDADLFGEDDDLPGKGIRRNAISLI